MHHNIARKPQQDLTSLAHLLRQRLQTGTSLVYFASGRNVNPAYYKLPFDNIVLVDYAFKSTFAVRGKVMTIGLTALQATLVFREAGIQFDAFVCINEGLSEGGGYYAINGNWSMGTILPILKDSYLHFACPEYYGRSRWKKQLFDLPQQAIALSPDDDDYVDPSIFSSYSRYDHTACVWRVTKQAGEPVQFSVGQRQISVQRKNIWDDYAQLDCLMVRCSPSEDHTLERMSPKVRALWRPGWLKIDLERSFRDILDYCNAHQIEILGLTPWLGGRYRRFISFLQENETRYPFPKQVCFYHLNKGDYRELYKMGGELDKYLKEQCHLFCKTIPCLLLLFFEVSRG